MNLVFTKMQALGNDFVVVDATTKTFNLTREQISAMADRHFGVGFDQLLIVESSIEPDVDFNYRIFNADGGEVEQCGNGARCLARFIHDQGLSQKTHLTVRTLGGKLKLQLEKNNHVNVDMGMPEFAPERIPFISKTQAIYYDLTVGDLSLTIGSVSLGNPHAVIEVEDLDKAPVKILGQKIEQHAQFPNGVNVGFMQIIRPDYIRLRVFERGAGETLACGSGACAAVVVGKIRGLLNDKVTVALPGGELTISWAGSGQPVWMAGPAETVFVGKYLVTKKIAS